MTFLNQTNWNADSSVVWKELVSRFGQEAYDDEDIRAEKQAVLQAEYDANAYARTRATAYPSLADQADMQFHDAVDGTTTWQDAIQAVKDANPKPV